MSNIRKLPWSWHAGILSALLGGISTACVAVLYYLVSYLGGRGMIHWALASELSFLLCMFGWGVSFLIFFLLHHLFQTTQYNSVNVYTVLVVVFMFLAHFLICFQIGPVGRIWTNGLIAGMKSRGHLHELQAWGIDRLTEYQKGILKTVDSKDSAWLLRKKLDPTIIPEYVKNIGGTPPSEGINIAMIPSSIVNPDTVIDNRVVAQ